MKLRHLLGPPGAMALAAALLSLFSNTAQAQETPSKCGSVTVATATPAQLSDILADADCFTREGVNRLNSARTRLQRAIELSKVKPPVPPVVPPIVTPVADPINPAEITPIADNFDPTPLVYTGAIPDSAAPDNVGAFRFICYSSHLNWDDSILAQGVIGGSMHGHENFGNTLGDGKSTYASLRTTGDSTCHNKINRGHYWVPWLQTEAGKVIRSKYMILYYKRRPKTDPYCYVMAPKGCVDLPSGFRAVSGFDPKLFGQIQPENNRNYNWRCNAGRDGQISEHRATINEALADCKLGQYDEVEILTSLAFGECWNGLLDSADHRSHLARPSYDQQGDLRCPKGYDYVLPQLTESTAYDVRKEDGQIRLSCDVMNGQSVPAGTCFHGDYREAWSPVFLKRFQDNCLQKMLNCSFMAFGDGTYGKQLPDTRGLPRLIDAPVRPQQIASVSTTTMSGMSH